MQENQSFNDWIEMTDIFLIEKHCGLIVPLNTLAYDRSYFFSSLYKTVLVFWVILSIGLKCFSPCIFSWSWEAEALYLHYLNDS